MTRALRPVKPNVTSRFSDWVVLLRLTSIWLGCAAIDTNVGHSR
jgi:hypothetical protein